MTQDETILFEIRPSTPRRIFGALVMFLLGTLLIYIAFASPPADLGWRAFLILIGIAALVNGVRGWQASEGAIVLTERGLFDHEGAVIAAIDQIEKVDRALFTFKPSNGFLVKMTEKQPFKWSPGMYWRIGKRVGIGGVTSGAETKIVADSLSMMVATRDGDTGL